MRYSWYLNLSFKVKALNPQKGAKQIQIYEKLGGRHCAKFVVYFSRRIQIVLENKRKLGVTL